jgi:type IV pilus assembly protein PilC
MPVFVYDGKTARGAKVSGERIADTKAALTALLQRERITPTKIKEKGKEFVVPTFGGTKVTAKDLAIFFRQFSVMIDSGLPLVQCLEILGGNQENEAFKTVLTAVRSKVETGSTLAKALSEHPKVFDALVVNMIEAGETGGILDTILQRLSGYVEKAVKLKSAVKSALIYPVSVVSIAVLVITLLLWKVVPIFANLFAGLGVEMPLPTRIVLGLSHTIALLLGFPFGFVTFGSIIAGFFLLKSVYATENGRYTIDSLMLKLPVLGMLLRKIAVARFTRTLGTLITSGVPLMEALSITARTSGNAVIERTIMGVRKAVEEGRTLTDPLRESEVFPNMVTQMIAVGEQTGAMDTMLQKIADFYEDEVDAAVKDLLTLMEPMIISFLGVSVGGVVISMYLPMFSLIAKMAG